MKLLITIFLILLSQIVFSKVQWNLNYGDKDLSNFTVNNKKLKISLGKGDLPPQDWKVKYKRLKEKGVTEANFPFQWGLVDLASGKVLSKSLTPRKLFYGASTTKIMVGSAFLQKLENPYSSKYFQDLLNMIVVSSNPSWRTIQYATGGEKRNLSLCSMVIFTL